MLENQLIQLLPTSATIPADVVLTADSVLVEKLRRKLAEYNRRLARVAPEVDVHGRLKQALLVRLLEDGCLHRKEVLRQELYERFGQYTTEFRFLDWFDDAFGIIERYNRDAIDPRIYGGTGLN